MRFGAAILLALVGAAACSSKSSQPNYGPCTPGDGKLPPCNTCQCAGGVWQAVTCPADLPKPGQDCSPEGAYCGYATETNPCGAANCYCQGGSWNCGPTCAIDAGGSSD